MNRLMKPRLFWDLDETLLNTSALLLPVLENLASAVGRTPEEIRRDIATLDAGGFTWERLFQRIGLPASEFDRRAAFCATQYACAEQYLFPGAREAVEELSGLTEQILVTFGDRVFQRRKWSALRSLHPFFHAAHFVDGETIGKGPLIASYDSTNRFSLFADDSRRWLDDCAGHAPHVICVRMAHAPGEPFLDGGTIANEKVAHSHDQVVSLIRRLAG